MLTNYIFGIISIHHVTSIIHIISTAMLGLKLRTSTLGEDKIMVKVKKIHTQLAQNTFESGPAQRETSRTSRWPPRAWRVGF